jgi:hypothetical protein
LDPPPPDPGPPATPLPGPGCADVVEVDVARATEIPITAHVSTTATIHVVLFDSNRRTLSQRACLVMVTEAGESGEDAGAGVGTLVSSGLVGSYSFMMAFLLLKQLRRECRPFM